MIRIDRHEVAPGDLVEVRIVSTSGGNRQGVRVLCDGGLEIEGREFPGDLVLWEDSPRESTLMRVGPGATELRVYNCWGDDFAKINAWIGGAAMRRVNLKGGYRYLCNDGEPDAKFDDIVFELSKSFSTPRES